MSSAFHSLDLLISVLLSLALAGLLLRPART
jgi:hypothetical protein